MKRVVLTKSLVVLLVSVLITSFSFSSYAQRGSRSNDLLKDSIRHESGIPNLTAEQKTKIDGLRVKHLKEVMPIKNELAEKKAHLNTLESTEKVDRDAINKTIDEISALQGKIMKMKVNHRLDVASVLTTDEQKVFFNTYQERVCKGHIGMGHKMKKGMGDGMGDRMGPNCQIDHPNCPMNNK